MQKKLILGSTSKYRKQLLERLGLSFECCSPGIVEEEVKLLNLTPLQMAETLAYQKAESVFQLYPDACVIGGDQLLHFEGNIYGKAGSKEMAVQQLMTLAGKSHDLITSIVVMNECQVFTHTDTTRLHMRNLSQEQLKRYVDFDNPIYCAGSYMLEKQGITLFNKIESDDQTSIIGLPLIALTGILTEIGYRIP